MSSDNLGMGFSKNSGKKQITTKKLGLRVTRSQLTSSRPQATIGPLYHFANRLNDVDHCSQRGGLASIALAPQVLLLSLLMREKFEMATGVLRGPATVVHTLGGTGLLPRLAASSSRAANPLVTLLA